MLHVVIFGLTPLTELAEHRLSARFLALSHSHTLVISAAGLVYIMN